MDHDPRTKPSSVTLRRLTAPDAPAFQALRLAALQAAPAAFGASYDEEANFTLSQVCERIQARHDGAPFVYGAFTSAGELGGVCGLYRERGAKAWHVGWIWTMYVAGRFRRQGVGRQLLDRAIEAARALPELVQIQLKVGSENNSARRLYESAGFRQIALLPRALRVDGRFVDERVMLLDCHAA